MTPAEVARVLEHVAKRWPHAQLPAETGDVWLEDLERVPMEAAMAAVRGYARAGERFPPTSGWVVSEVERASQAPAPSFEDVQRFIARHASRLPYDGHSAEHTAEAVRALAEAGAHEAVLRFVQTQGVYAVRMMPDPSMQPLDMNQQADRRDKAREYRDRTVREWQADPRPGLALERARDVAQLGTAAPAGLRRADGLAGLLPGPQS